MIEIVKKRKKAKTKSEGTGHCKEAIRTISTHGAVIRGSSGVGIHVNNLTELMALREEQNNRDNR